MLTIMEVDGRKHVDEEKSLPCTNKLAAVWLISPQCVTITSLTSSRHIKIQPASGLRMLDAVYHRPRTLL